MKSSEDQIYIERIRKGDSASYAYLVDKYKDMAFTVANKVMRNSEDAEDVAQESFVKAYQQIHTFEGKSKFSTWLYTIVYRTAISKLRKKKFETSSISEEIVENYSPDVSTPQIEDMKAEEQKIYVKEAINKLPEMDALLITLFYMNENTPDEIQEITGLTKVNIKVKLHRARKKLQKELQFLLQHELNSIL